MKNGGVVQLADKEKMQEWPIELPLLFIEYIKNKQLDSYGSAKKEVEKYLDEILEEVAIPRLISVLKGVDNEEIVLALTRIEEISKKNADMAKPISKYLDELLKRNKKQIVKLALKLKIKAEIQAFASHGFKFLTDRYLPEKLTTGDWI